MHNQDNSSNTSATPVASIFVKGQTNPNRPAFGVVILLSETGDGIFQRELRLSGHADPDASLIRVTLQGIMAALEYLDTIQFSGCEVVVRSDLTPIRCGVANAAEWEDGNWKGRAGQLIKEPDLWAHFLSSTRGRVVSHIRASNGDREFTRAKGRADMAGERTDGSLHVEEVSLELRHTLPTAA